MRIKFTETGAVEVLLGEPSSRGLGFSVGDTGMGIPTGKLEAIFEEFQQADGSTSREYGGTGLGLSISRKLADLMGGDLMGGDLMGGDLMVQSTENEGSVFTLTLPFASAGQEPPTKPVSAAPDPTPADETPRAPIPSEAAPVASFLPDDRDYIQPGDRVLLIVEDDAGFAGVLLGLARKAGYKVLAAGDGRSALFLARHFLPSGHRAGPWPPRCRRSAGVVRAQGGFEHPPYPGACRLGSGGFTAAPREGSGRVYQKTRGCDRD